MTEIEKKPLNPRQNSTSSTTSTTSSKGSKKSSTSVSIENYHKCSLPCLQRYPLHHAARLGKYPVVQKLLEEGKVDPLEPDECLGRTPLHYACGTGNVDKGLVCIKMLLGCNQIMKSDNPSKTVQEYVNHVDKRGKTALHIATVNEATAIVTELLINQANFDAVCCEGECALMLIYNKTPDSMEVALNQSITYAEACGRQTLSSDNVNMATGQDEFDFSKTWVNFCLDFYPVIGTFNPDDEDSTKECKPRKNSYMFPETSFLFRVNRERMATQVRRQILTNVLVQSFLFFKWHKVMPFCFVAIAFHTVWLLLYIYTVVKVYVMDCPYSIPNEGNNDTSLEGGEEGSLEEDQVCHISYPLHICFSVLFCLSVMVAVKEFFQLIRLKTMYFRFENFGQLTLLSFIFYMAPCMHSLGLIVGGWKPGPVEYQMAAFGIFLGWTLFLGQLAKLPRVCLQFHKFGKKWVICLPDHGIYVEILSRVLKNFLIFITIFSCLLVSFVFSFSILLPNSPGFASFPSTLLKVLTMLTGELNYDEIFHNDDSEVVFPISSQVMYAIFIILATIILFNLLIGFTVSDIQGLQADAEINQISNKLEQIFLMECFLLSKGMQRIVKYMFKMVGKSNYEDVFESIMVIKSRKSPYMCYHTKICSLPTPLRCEVRKHASKNCLAISDISGVARSTMFSNREFHH